MFTYAAVNQADLVPLLLMAGLVLAIVAIFRKGKR